MRNRISCTAQTLRQLEPDMIHAVVGGQVFKLGNQYFTESRVTILEADNMQILAEVSGTFGVYSQTIKLRSGTLLTKCSCPSNEQPFCRHCVAVMLHHYHDQVAEKMEASKAEEPVDSIPKGNGSTAASSGSSSSDFNFRDVTVFVDWIQEAIPILGNGEKLPKVPSLPPGGVTQWIEAIQTLHQRFLKGEEERIAAQRELTADEEQIKGLTYDLEQSRREAKDAQGACVGLQKEIERCQASLADLSAVRKERDQLVQQINTMRVDLQAKCSELNDFSATLQTLSKTIQAILPSQPSSKSK